MELKINNRTKTVKEVTITLVDGMNKYKIEPNESITVPNPRDLAELECNNSIFLIPTLVEPKSLSIIDDLEIARNKFQLVFGLILLLAIVGGFTFYTLNVDLSIKLALIAIEVITALVVWFYLNAELKANVIFFED